MAITISIAKTSEDIDEVFKIRYKVFHDEENLLGEDPNSRIMDRYDAFPTTWNLVVKKQDHVIGSMRLSIDSGVGVPADEWFNYRSHIPENSLIMHCGMFCVTEGFRSPKITAGLMLMATYFGMSHNVTHVLAPINPVIVKLLKRVGFEQVGEEFIEPHLKMPLLPLMLDVKRLSDFFIHFVKENQLQDYIGEYDRAFYDEGEHVIQAGEPGKQAFIIIEGSVQVRLPGNGDIIETLKEGDVFGELALLFDEPRTADVIAVTELQVMTLSKEAFRRMFFQDPQKTLNLVQILAKRNKNMITQLQSLKK